MALLEGASGWVVTEGSGFSLEALPLHHVAQEVGKVDVEQVPTVRHHDLCTTSPPPSPPISSTLERVHGARRDMCERASEWLIATHVIVVTIPDTQHVGGHWNWETTLKKE
jgi:hypothetical protein